MVMVLSSEEIGAPNKVLDLMVKLGVHNDCIASPNTACNVCIDSAMAAFDYFYGHLHSTEDVIRAVSSDYISDRAESEAEQWYQ